MPMPGLLVLNYNCVKLFRSYTILKHKVFQATVGESAEAPAPMTLHELVTKINQQANVPVSRADASEAVRSISDEVMQLPSGKMHHKSVF